MLSLDSFDMETFPQETGNDVDLFLSSYEQPIIPASFEPQFASSSWEPNLPYEQSTVVDVSSQNSPTLPVWQPVSTVSTSTKRVHPPVERETKVKKRKQQHQMKDKERRHRINEGLRQLGTLVQNATGTFAKLDQPTIVSSSITLINSLQSELMALRAQLAGASPKEKSVVVAEEKTVVKSEAHGHHEGSCPIFSSMAGAGVALIMIRAEDLSIVEANSVLANILGYTDSTSFVGTAVWDKPLHSRLYQLDRHGRVVNENSNPFAFSEPKVKVEDGDYFGQQKSEEDSHIDCLWTARTANGNTLSARVTLSVLKGHDAKPTHFLLCSLPSQRQVSTTSASLTQTVQVPEIEVAC